MGMLSKKIYLAKVLFAGLTGTTFMTLFSYLVSETKEENFKEPELLGKLLYRLIPDLNKQNSRFAGWSLHYVVGFIFAFLYARLWEERKIKPTVESGLMLGGLSGVLAIIVWKSTFKLHPLPPKIYAGKYYGHLLITHFIFGAFAVLGYKLWAGDRIPSQAKRVDKKELHNQEPYK
jgi:hypothetical protein